MGSNERAGGLAVKVEEIAKHRDRDWAVKNFQRTVIDLIGWSGASSVLEVGGGRSPFLKQKTIEQLGVAYTSSDILASEVALAPDWIESIVLDVQTPDKSLIAPYAGKYDFAFSKWVMEHVGNYKRAYSNIYDILQEGGIYIALHPILYSLPFVVNRIAPDSVTAPVLRLFFPHRNDAETPKFPALYSGCRISGRVREDIRAIGFRQVWQLPFYGHNYYSKIPVLREMHRAVTAGVRGLNLTPMASFAYTIVQK
ncbi:class I SAM-dependent methyltransferase [Sphingomonas canadensis]|uniref:Class I SAM-dependent methyltransferase n=1 Tax=Sphingomonas canadensis TaxID=1219257 RepID=A0ABW3H6V7_9SPHN|nr:class I SAM-dependent methyltransferase [Sphingomonas canadensis]MCW3837114.1 class I SAM-dependent methyltransferase [Sphingomonas canadensis]